MRRMRTEDVQRLAGRIYPYVAAELFLRWSEDELPAVVAQHAGGAGRARAARRQRRTQLWRRPPPTSDGGDAAVAAGADHDPDHRALLPGDRAADPAPAAAQITQKQLEERCQLMAQRMTMLYGFNSPEFFDPSLFENFIDLLRARGVVRTDEAGRLLFDEVLIRVAADAQLVLSEQIRHSILQVTHG